MFPKIDFIKYNVNRIVIFYDNTLLTLVHKYAFCLSFKEFIENKLLYNHRSQAMSQDSTYY